MKLSDIKHNHSLTDLLKVFIFSILMLLPFLSVLTRCMYVTFNKNAYQSYSGENIPPTENINIKAQNLINNNYYYFQNFENVQTGNSYYFYYISECEVEPNATRFRYYINGDTLVKYIQFFNGDTTISYTPITNVIGKSFLFISYANTPQETDYMYNINAFYQIKYNEFNKIDNVFEYSFQKMSQDDMFNWTQNTALYSGINAMTTNLQIQTNVIAILLTYWTILTIVYVIIDIVLKCFTLLTHGFSRKTS